MYILLFHKLSLEPTASLNESEIWEDIEDGGGYVGEYEAIQHFRMACQPATSYNK